MSRKYQGDVVFIEERHEVFAVYIEGAVIRAVPRRTVHEDDQPFPGLLGRSQILVEPGCFIFHHRRTPAVQFFIIRIEGHVVDVAIIEGVSQAVLVLRAAIGHGEQGLIRIRFGKFPIHAIGFVVAQDRRKGDMAGQYIGVVKPVPPLEVSLTVVGNVAHVDKESRIIVLLPGDLRRLPPDAVIGGLRVAEDEDFVFV